MSATTVDEKTLDSVKPVDLEINIDSQSPDIDLYSRPQQQQQQQQHTMGEEMKVMEGNTLNEEENEEISTSDDLWSVPIPTKGAISDNPDRGESNV